MNTMIINLTSVFNAVFSGGSSSSSSSIIVTPTRSEKRLIELRDDTDKKEDENNCAGKKSSKRLIDVHDKDIPEDLIGSNVKKKNEVGLDVIDMIYNDKHIKNLSL